MKNQILQKHPALRGVFKKCYFFNNLILFLCILLFTGCTRQTPVIGTAFMMDTIVEYKFYGPPDAGKKVENALAEFEKQCSMYVEDSEIARLNREAGKNYAPLSPDVHELLRRCADYGAESGGVFDVTIAPLTALWDITGVNPRVPSDEEIDALMPLVDYRSIDVRDDGNAMLKKTGQMVDLGGIAKGYACDIARRAALDAGVKSGYLSVGGNIMAIGKQNGEDFRFGVRAPRGGSNEYMAVVTLPDTTMATSGDYERYFERDGVRYHHILDPATGAPAKTDLMSVSVISSDGTYADYMSTFLFIKGKDYALGRLNTFDCGLILIDKDRNVFVSDNAKERFMMADKTGTYRYDGGGA